MQLVTASLLQSMSAEVEMDALLSSDFVRQLAGLGKALSKLDNLSQRPWPPLLNVGWVSMSLPHSQLDLIADRLRLLGDLDDAGLDQAVRRFQRRHGLEQDGVVGPKTRGWLNVPPSQRMQMLSTDWLRSWLMQSRSLGRRVEVNIPDYRLNYWRDDQLILSSRVIVGRTDRPTPMLQYEIQGLVMNPSWHVPVKIMRKDILPKLRHNPHYLRRSGMRVMTRWHGGEEVDYNGINWSDTEVDSFPYRLVQAPGPKNALGSVKFAMPNPNNVFLHHTSQPQLFSRHTRTFSSGCVRVEKARQLAQLLLLEQGWGPVKWFDAEYGGETKFVSLVEPVPVLFVYQLAWLQDGERHFRDDIYGLDPNTVPVAEPELLAESQDN